MAVPAVRAEPETAGSESQPYLPRRFIFRGSCRVF